LNSKGGFVCKQTIQARDVGWAVLDVALSPDGRHLGKSFSSQPIPITLVIEMYRISVPPVIRSDNLAFLKTGIRPDTGTGFLLAENLAGNQMLTGTD
jgi:hypothetical protein